MKHNSLLTHFERDVEKYFPDIEREISRKRPFRLKYLVTIPVECYATRRVTIHINRKHYRVTKIVADGPSSKHRYGEKELCVWYNGDGPTEKWVYQDGLLALLRLIEAHLFREAHWRETGGKDGGEWLGPEVEH